MTEDLSQHLKWFLQLSDTFKYNGAPGSIMTWGKLARKFLQKFFPISKTIHLRREIAMFKQLVGESSHEA
ncbi:NADH--cytochrome b5 reductase 1-like [Gossypium australe]|uniref:NADH--cytochrome b5 reductase 1-like n=1 Tax=Gossypium australe TaxID=47621 RepID=A0A5B6V9F1_9ROSI|nr:NADH--cytochrome b5 reductase 1-like [Gossypium australe]